MKSAVLGLTLFATLLPAAADKGKRPDVLVEEIDARREDRRILIDGVVVANREKPIKGMRVRFELLAPGEQLLSWQEARLSEEELESGDEVPFYLQCADHVRAVAIRVDLRDGKKMYLRADNPGPYPIHD